MVPVAQSASAPPLEVAPAPCLNGPTGLRCDGLIDRREAEALPGDIGAAREAVMRTAFADVHPVVLLARLTLRRDGDQPDIDGKDDVARGLRWAQVAVAVDDTYPEARLALAIAVARSLQSRHASADPALREPALALAELALRAVPPGSSRRVGAAVKTVEGYLALERGQPAPAKAAFAAATQIDPDLGTAWVGLGDAARSTSDFAAATAAYERARSRLPDDAGIARALQAAARREPLALPAPSVAAPPLAAGPLAPVPPPPPTCSPAEAAHPAAAQLCQGLERLAGASSRAEKGAAAKLIIAGWTAMRPSCDAGDTACGRTVVLALAAASRSFQDAGQTAKSIAAAKMVLDPRNLPGAAEIAPRMALEIGDAYFSLGVFEPAADYYALHAKRAGANPGPETVAAADRALRLYVALGNAGSATSLAADLARNTHHAAAQRAIWLTLAEAAKPRPVPKAPAVVCAAPLTCAVRRLAGETW
jgi:tetratricopeptide (TPR) repeat protein